MGKPATYKFLPTALNMEGLNHAGSSIKFSKKRVVEQAAIIIPDNRLLLQIGDKRFDCDLP